MTGSESKEIENEIVCINKYCYYFFINYECGASFSFNLSDRYMGNKGNELRLVMCFLDNYTRFVGYKRLMLGNRSEYKGIMITLDGSVHDSIFYSNEGKFVKKKTVTRFRLISNADGNRNENINSSARNKTEVKSKNREGDMNDLLVKLVEPLPFYDDKEEPEMSEGRKLECCSLMEFMRMSGIKKEHIELIRSKIKYEDLMFSSFVVTKKGIGDVLGIKELGYRIKIVNCIKKYRMLYKRALSLKKYSIKERMISLGFNNEIIYNALFLSLCPLNSILCSFSHSGINIPFEQLVFIRKLDGECGSSDSKTNSSYYLGRWLGKEVAIKVFKGRIMKPELWESTCKLIWSLRHPNLVLTLGFCHSHAEDVHCVVTEYINSGSLDKYLIRRRGTKNSNSNVAESNVNYGMMQLKERICLDIKNTLMSSYFEYDNSLFNGGIDVQDALIITREIAYGCYYLNQRGFFHLGLKPSNILLVNKCGNKESMERSCVEREPVRRYVELHGCIQEKNNNLGTTNANDEANVSVKLADVGHFLLEASFYDTNFSKIELHKSAIDDAESECNTFSDIITSPKTVNNKILNYYPPEVLVKILPLLEPARLYIHNDHISCKNIDSYSLGIILWEMIYGELPFSGMNNIEIQIYVGYIGTSVIRSKSNYSSFTIRVISHLIKKMCGYSNKVFRNRTNKVYKLCNNSTNQGDYLIRNSLFHNEAKNVAGNNIQVKCPSFPSFSHSRLSRNSSIQVDGERNLGHYWNYRLDNDVSDNGDTSTSKLDVNIDTNTEIYSLSSLLLEIVEKGAGKQTKRMDMKQIIDEVGKIENKVSYGRKGELLLRLFLTMRSDNEQRGGFTN